MPNREVSTGSLIARLKALLRRHRELDDWIDTEQARGWPDTQSLKHLKLERLELRDAIREIKSTLTRSGMNPPSLS